MLIVYSISDIPSGLNNQKLALIGLSYTAYLENAKVIFPPYLVDFKPRPKLIRKSLPDGHIKFSDVFDRSSLVNVLYKYNLFSELSATSYLNFHDMFRIGVAAVRDMRRTGNPECFLADLIVALRASPELRSIACSLWAEVKSFPNLVGLQLRIERDFLEYLDKKDDLVTPRTASEIFRRLSELNDFNGANLLLSCDEDDLSMHKDLIRLQAINFGFHSFFKSDLKSSSLLPQSRLQQSAIEFEILLKFDRYVGLSKSTFSNMLKDTQWCMSAGIEQHGNHYQYDRM